MLPICLIAASIALYPAIANAAFSFDIKSTPQQCQNLSISITGAGQPPYSVLIIPFGPTPLPNNVEARRIENQNFTGNSNSISFQLAYPTNSQFVAVVSDSAGFGSGGTSVAATVLSSSDSSCFDPNTNVSPDFVFSIQPPNQLVQCQSTRIWWDPNSVQGNPSFLGVIPGGQSFEIPNPGTSQVPSQGTGFSWTPSLRGGTTLLLIGGDNRGIGSAGSVLNTVSSGTSTDNSCLNANSPSSTPGSPAGGTYPTSTSGASTGGGGGGGTTNIGAIIGGVVGGVAGLLILVLLGLFFFRRKKHTASQKERPVNLLQGDEGDGATAAHQLPQYYQPEPFVVPDPTAASHADDASSAHGGGGTQGPGARSSRSQTPDLLGLGVTSASTASRKSAGGPRMLRPVNVIQHDDAGPSVQEEDGEGEEGGEPETVELPPAYTNIRK